MICFHNPGCLDLRCLRAFGVNVKPLTDNAIGQFGSGLKCAVAIALRLKQTVTLYIGLDRYTFKTKSVSIRGKAFDFVVLVYPDGTEEEMSFNTHIGEHWPNWAMYREWASNALDEGGNTFHLPDNLPYSPREDETAFVVQGAEIEAAHAARHTIFLQSAPIWANENIEIHRGESEHAYYRGIRVLDLPRKSLFTYNLRRKVELTEDRTLKNSYELDSEMGKAMSTIGDEAILNAVLIASEDVYEHHISAVWGEMPADVFCRVYEDLRNHGHALGLTRFATDTYLKRRGKLPIPEEVTLNRLQKKQLTKAVAFCHALGWTVDEYPILTVPQQRDGLLAWAQDGKIVLTTQCFDKGTTELASTILEEWLHLRHGFKDCSRAFQTHLFQTIMALGQQVVGEPL